MEFDLRPRKLDVYIVKKFITTFFVALLLIIGIVIIFLKESFFKETMWDISLNPFSVPDEIHPVIWASTVLKNRIFLSVGFVVWMMLGLLNLQKREKFV